MDAIGPIALGVFVILCVTLVVLKLTEKSATPTTPHWQIEDKPDEHTWDVYEAHCVANQRRSGHERGGRVICHWRPGEILEWNKYGKWLERYGTQQGVFLVIEK